MAKKQRYAAYLGISISTTAVGMLVRSRQGHEDFVSCPMIGRTAWHGEPAFAHEALPLLLLYCLLRLEDRGWIFKGQKGCFVIAIRQHDLTLADEELNPLGPAITWESNVAEREAQALNANPKVRREVGPVTAARMLTPKAEWLLKAEPGLRSKIRYLLTTADWCNAKLSNGAVVALGSSDGLSNAILCQATKRVARQTLKAATLDPAWVPPTIESGQIVGKVGVPDERSGTWSPLLARLSGWSIGAPLADNASGAWGMSVFGSRRMVLSAGSSGTAVCVCQSNKLGLPQLEPLSKNHPPPLRFEFFTDSLFLTMRPRAGLAWDFFRNSLSANLRDDFGKLNALATKADLGESRMPFLSSDAQREYFPKGWANLPLAQQVAAVQFSIAAGMLTVADELLCAIRPTASEPAECALTGGLSGSPFFQETILTGMGMIAPQCKVYVSSRTGPARFQAAARGAMMAAMLKDRKWDFAAIAEEMDAVQECHSPPATRKKALEQRLAPILAAAKN